MLEPRIQVRYSTVLSVQSTSSIKMIDFIEILIGSFVTNGITQHRTNSMRSVLFLFIVSILVVTATAGCACINGSCTSYYRGTRANCFCWCQKEANARKLGKDATCRYMIARENYSCSLCSRGIFSPNEDDSQDLSLDGESQITSITVNESNTEHVFQVKKCFCCGSCTQYSGSAKQCSSCVYQFREKFINEDYYVNYAPWYSSGGSCSACGNVDPCTY
ncbi:hypothetical protein RCL1_008646 [Eukaryota sp. TZLM3-RCL]